MQGETGQDNNFRYLKQDKEMNWGNEQFILS